MRPLIIELYSESHDRTHDRRVLFKSPSPAQQPHLLSSYLSRTAHLLSLPCTTPCFLLPFQAAPSFLSFPFSPSSSANAHGVDHLARSPPSPCRHLLRMSSRCSPGISVYFWNLLLSLSISLVCSTCRTSPSPRSRRHLY